MQRQGVAGAAQDSDGNNLATWHARKTVESGSYLRAVWQIYIDHTVLRRSVSLSRRVLPGPEAGDEPLDGAFEPRQPLTNGREVAMEHRV